MSTGIRERESVPVVVTIVAVVAVLGYFAAEASLLSWRLGFPLDDSWIHLQFARNLAAGGGLSYNPGELVTGSTSPLWTALLSLLFHLPGNVVVWAKLAGAVAFVLAARATFRLGRLCGLAPGLATLAALLVAATYWLVWSALSGMEICLFLWLSLAGMILQARELRGVDDVSGGGPAGALALPVLALAALARPEGLLLLALALAERAVRVFGAAPGGAQVGRRAVLRREALGLAGALVLLLPPLLFNLRVGGSWLPTTFGAKAGGAHGLLPDGQYLFMVFGVLFRPQPWSALLATAGAVALLVRRLGDRGQSVLVALWALGLPLAYALLAPPGRSFLLGNFGRYYFPLFAPLAVLACVALAALGRGREPRRLGRLLLGALLLLPTLYTLVQGAGFYARNVANVEDGDVRMARWLARHVPAPALVAVQDIGAIKFFAPQRIVDVAGIATPEVQRAVRDAMSEADPGGQSGMLRFLAERRPDYLVAFPSWYPALVASGSGFEPVYTLAVPDNITLAGDRLVVYRTPWTRFALTGDEP